MFKRGKRLAFFLSFQKYQKSGERNNQPTTFNYLLSTYSLVCHKIVASESHSGSGFGSKSE